MYGTCFEGFGNVLGEGSKEIFGGEKIYGETRLEPFETLADNSKAKNTLSWEPKGNLSKWIKHYKMQLGI